MKHYHNNEVANGAFIFMPMMSSYINTQPGQVDYNLW